ncbi:asparagine--tRNA ligase [Aureibacter tunicatorum]|uniref:Asparagine--tRNA ligase n=1 Tax=Aureibacter tunicatorum TaxID=866807 RepID=A0AAE3XJ24_9BACT|nr:asparaginyl-tRNA synthetase [Aureibacter tunicatorum]
MNKNTITVTTLRRTKIKTLLESAEADIQVCVKGWVRTKRGNKHVSFIALNDGSTINNLQVVADPNIISEEILKDVTTGASLSVVGKVVASQGSGQSVEILAEAIEVIGKADPDSYPLQPKKHSLEFLREIAHLRPRTNTFSAIYRLRHAMIFAVHKFFNDKGFLNIHTPLITHSDAEGAGETFKVTTIDPKNPPMNEEGEVDYKQDFFGKETNLTVSGQLEGELAALAMGDIYTFGPTFRAENSNTSRHLAEFWMIEPEMAFADLDDDMDLAEEFLKYLVSYALDNCKEDLAFLAKRSEDEEKSKPAAERHDMGLIERLQFVRDNEFQRITYTEAIDILKNSKPNKKKKFKFIIDEWGADLQSEHERFLVEKHFKKPVIITNYPKDIKAFYMKLNDDNKTVAAMDMLFPGIGEIVGGSQREENLDLLMERMKQMEIPEHDIDWYLDTRKFGTVPHSGFGLGFERLMLFVSGMSNIRDVIPFPRTPQHCEF